jgi:quercetin dioxygenase-like cupin family protein
LARGTAEPFEIESSGVEVEAERRTDVAVVKVVYEPGGTSGWHTHPGPTIVTIAKGSFTFFTEDCKGHKYTAGDTFVEEGPNEVGKLTNTGSSTGRIVLTVFAPPEQPDTTIPASAPRACR